MLFSPLGANCPPTPHQDTHAFRLFCFTAWFSDQPTTTTTTTTTTTSNTTSITTTNNNKKTNNDTSNANTNRNLSCGQAVHEAPEHSAAAHGCFVDFPGAAASHGVCSSSTLSMAASLPSLSSCFPWGTLDSRSTNSCSKNPRVEKFKGFTLRNTSRLGSNPQSSQYLLRELGACSTISYCLQISQDQVQMHRQVKIPLVCLLSCRRKLVRVCLMMPLRFPARPNFCAHFASDYNIFACGGLTRRKVGHIIAYHLLCLS